MDTEDGDWNLMNSLIIRVIVVDVFEDTVFYGYDSTVAYMKSQLLGMHA